MLKKTYLLLLLLFLGCLCLKAQQNTRRLSYTQLFEEIQNTKDTVYILENATIYYEHKTDSLRFGSPYSFPSEWMTETLVMGEMNGTKINYRTGILNYRLNSEKFNAFLERNLPLLIINKNIFLTNVDFQGDDDNNIFRRIKFKGFFLNNKNIQTDIQKERYCFFTFENCDFEVYMPYLRINDDTPPKNKNDNYHINFVFCSFKCSSGLSPLTPTMKISYGGEITGDWFFYDCIFKSYTGISLKKNTKYLTFKDCTFNEELYIGDMGIQTSSIIRLKKSTFLSLNNKFSLINIGGVNGIEIDSCIFEKSRLQINTSCKTLSVTNSTFKGGFSLVDTKITDELFLEDNNFSKFTLSSGSAKSQSGRNLVNWGNSFVPYEQFKSNLGSYLNDSTTYFGITTKELSNETEYKHLKSHYDAFYKMYSDKKDKESANACYIALKDLETRKLAYNYQHKDNSFKAYLNWKLNVFLRYFCDYGTDPVKALEKSVYWVLIFAFLYVIFPSEKDYLHKSILMPKLQRWAGYLKKEEGFSALEDAKRQEKIMALERFREELKNTEDKIPTVLSIFSKPLYASTILYYKLHKWFIHKIDFTQGRWSGLSKKKMFFVSMGIFFYLLAFVLWGIIMRGVNALTLSLNCFITLGYGEISATGIARYLAVLEGMFGWFLLTIFSVSLIGQILN